jgi:hypothetical protein
MQEANVQTNHNSSGRLRLYDYDDPNPHGVQPEAEAQCYLLFVLQANYMRTLIYARLHSCLLRSL